jgi:hypothetical protein
MRKAGTQMYCPTCGRQNAENTQRCISCGNILTGPVPVQAKTSVLAIVAFVLSILSPFTVGVAGVVAIVLSIIALVKIRRSHGRLRGAVFAILAIAISAVVLVLMILFIAGSALQYMVIRQHSSGSDGAVAYYGQQEKSKITREELSAAMQELEILQTLRMDATLKQQQDMRLILLGELLFSQDRGSAGAMNRAMQIIHQYRLPVSDRQLSETYNRPAPPAVYWILLRNEAESAGVSPPADEVSTLLTSMLPRLFPGQTYSAVIGSVVNRFRVPEETIVETVGRLLAVLQYAQVICSMEDITFSQLKHMASWAGDTLDVEFVAFDPRVFADKQSLPTDEAMRAHFNKYKGNYSGHVTDDNPFGFGYRLPDRVQLDYVALKLSDVARIVPAPTDEDTMKYYQQNRMTVFTEEVPSDPNDPNSPRIPRVRPYADVKELIATQLEQQRVSTKTEQILDEVRNQADANLQVDAREGKELSPEDAKARAGDYGKIAQEVAAKNGITLYSGQTGWLSATDIESDEQLSKLYVSGQGMTNVPLTQVLFSVDAFGPDAAVLMFAAKPRMYTTIGPARNPMTVRGTDPSGQIMMVARIVGASKAAEPESLDVTYSTKTLDLGEPAATKKDQTHSVQQQVARDLQTLAAWDATRRRVGEFVTMASRQGWDAAVAKFNDLYGKGAANDLNGDAFKLDRLTGQRRVPNVELWVIAAQAAGSPVGLTDIHQAEVDKRRIDLFFSLVPPGAASAANLAAILEFKPDRCLYAVKKLSVQWLSLERYQSGKIALLQWQDNAQTQSLAVAHFNPANILKRMSFKFAEPSPQPKQENPSPLGP